MPFVQLDDLKMYYEVHGEGEPMIMINGLKSDHTGWVPTLDAIKHGHKVILFDNRGVGQTTDEGKDFSVETMANDVKKLMLHLEIDSAYIVGHSLGGAIAQVFAHRYPENVKKLILCNTFIKFNDAAAEAFKCVLSLYHQGAPQSDIMDAVIPWVFVDGFVTPELRRFIHETSNANPHAQTYGGYRRQYDALIKFNSSAWVDSISVPTIVIGSEQDITALPEESRELASRIGAVLEILPGAHASAVEQGDKLSQMIKLYAQPSDFICRI